MDKKEKYVYEDKSEIPYGREAVGRFRLLIGILLFVGAAVLSGVSLLTGIMIGTAREQGRAGGGRTIVFMQGNDYDSALTNGDGTLTAAGVAEFVKDSVVEIICESDGVAVSCSGVVVSDDGFIATGYSVVANANGMQVKFSDGVVANAVFYAGDEMSDIAVLQAKRTGLKQVCFGNSDALRMGEPVVAMGRPVDGNAMTVGEGIVFALEHAVPYADDSFLCLQTTASAGVSLYGGGLFNMAGQLVGFMRPAPYQDGTSYVYPVNHVWPVVGDLITKGFVSGRVETELVSLREYGAQSDLVEPGVYVCALNDEVDNPFRVGDSILAVGGEKIDCIKSWVRVLNGYHVGDTVDVLVKRGGKTVEVQLKLKEKTIR